jgi:predicted MFS family arabinose efflux permease
LLLQTGSCLTLAILASVGDVRALGWLVLGSLATNLFAATQDIATDGLAVEQLSEAERGLGNGVQVAGYRVGMIVGGSGILVLLDAWGWHLALGVMCGLLALLALPIWLHREAPVQVGPTEKAPLLSFLQRPGGLSWLAVLIAYKFGDAVATAMFKPLMVDSGLTISEIGWLAGGLGSVSGMLGALVGGALFGRLGAKRALVTFGIASASSLCAYAAFGTHVGAHGFALLTILEHLVGGAATVALFATMMSHCRAGHEGSDYTIQASIVVLATGIGAAVSGFLAEVLGYSLLFLVASGLAVMGALFAGSRVEPATTH